MSTTKTPLLPGHWYHVYNRGINGERIFVDTENYAYFLTLMARHLVGTIEVYAYCLLSNHFHLLIRVREEPAKPAHQGLSNLCNSYAQAINKRYGRTGSLFERPFHRKQIASEIYRAAVLAYIHRNPAHHQICEDFRDYPHSSYQSLLSSAATHLKREDVLDWFGGREEFVEFHRRETDFEAIRDVIIER